MSETTAAPEGVLVIWRETPRPAKALLIGILVNKLAGFIQIFLVLFLTHQGFSTSQAGFALGVYGAGAVAGTFLGGALSDRLTPRAVTVLSLTGSSVLIVSVLYVTAYAVLLPVVFLVSTVGQLYRPAAQVLITELTPPNRLVMVTAMYRLSLNLGTTATPLLGTALVSVSYDLLFWGEALASLAYGAIALIALPRSNKQTSSVQSDAPAQPKGRYLAVFADWRYTFFLAAVLMMSIVYIQYTVTLPLAIVNAQLSMWWYGAVVSLNGVIVVTCELLATKFVQRWPLRLTAFSAFFFVAVGYGIYGIGMLPPVLVIGTLVWTLSEITGGPTVFAYPGLIAPEHLRGRYFGAFQSVFGIGQALGPIVGVALWNVTGQWAWGWFAVIAVLATVAAQIGIRRPADNG
jgi:predicted MFS family arabinose efflux permease